MPVLIGTSGWQYDHWRGRFYPAGLAQRRWFEHLLAGFRTVELNASFYRLPRPEVFEGWRARSPADAVVTVKASRYLTHVRRLRDPAEPVTRLMAGAARLGDKLGPVLVQLPPDLPAQPGLLEACLAAFPRGTRVAVELRHRSWWTAETERVLARHGAALAWADRGSRPVTPLWRTADWGYLRLHEGRTADWPRYGRAALAGWARRLAATWADGAQVFVYFNNDPGCAAVYDAIGLAAQLRRLGRTPTRTPTELTAGRDPTGRRPAGRPRPAGLPR